ncbi:endonuclease NucS domain-containing protein [Natronosalvus caseinilyticus]|uniref:endonuclease NucS domain-containing protein n=1 Tax=Natronosalvus caseinilyticus TaxID=2953747 RepID=UPI0028ACE040|nr:endonuclease NucS domain-containing protein [Natronosalvus caseinilyticus]
MEEGDIVIAYAPEKGHLTGAGTVGELRYDEDMSFRYLTEEEAQEAQVADHYYIRPVTWFDWGTPVQVTDLSKRFQVNGSDQLPTPGTFNRYGTLETHANRLETLAEEINQAETVESSLGGFGPEQESQIQEWVVNNIRHLGLKNPRREVRTAAGRIDVLADSDHGETVIEIKHGRAGDRALGQLLGYIGSRSEENSGPVSGILLADSFTSRVKHAEKILDDVTLYEFEVETRLQQV